MRSLSSSMTKTSQGSTIGLSVGEPRGASAEGQRPQQAGFKRRAQGVTLQQKNEYGCRHRVHGDIAPVLHRAALLRLFQEPCAVTRHVVSFSVVGPPTGAFTQAPRHSTSSQLKLPSFDRWKGS